MRTDGLAPVLRAMRSATGPDTGLRVAEIVERSGQPGPEVRAALRSMLQLEPSWIDADVLPELGMTWWLTPAGQRAAD